MSSENYTFCGICEKLVDEAYHYFGYDLCPKCNGKLFLCPVPDYIPKEQLIKYRISKLRKNSEKNY